LGRFPYDDSGFVAKSGPRIAICEFEEMSMRRNIFATLAVVATCTTICLSQTANSTAAVSAKQGLSAAGKPIPRSPNILFIIMDDVGIDQMRVFGYGGTTPPLTPNIDTIAHAGLRFRNAWSMPECSPSRAIFFEGRYPLRTNVNNAILSDDLANSQVSPYEVTTPEILKTVGYQSGLFGKFHLGGPDNNPFGYATPHMLGWDYFDGFMSGPQPIDGTIGGQFPINSVGGVGPYSCGLVPNSDFKNGADFGACHFSDGTCTDLSRTQQKPTPGRTCVEIGGLFVPKQNCWTQLRKPLNFDQANAYYVWPRVINQADGTVTVVPLSDPSARSYISEGTNSSATTWINQQNSAHQPWMATVSYSNIHTPYQQPLSSLLPANEPDTSGLQCTGNTTANEIATRVISNQMAEAMDTEIGNLFVDIGLATFNEDGTLNYHPEATNTTVIIVGDNGTFAPGVKEPFDSSRAKAWVYQTGVWVPLIVAGPQVVSPDREVTAMVNVADIFQLFGEIAGVDVHQVVPPSHILDSVSMLPYLTNPNQASLRQTNFTQSGNNFHTSPPSPCVIPLTQPATCVQLFNKKQLCNFEGGDWYPQYSSCCEVQNTHIYGDKLTILPDEQAATRNELYKLVQITAPDCSLGHDVTTNELYKINEHPIDPAIDKVGNNLCTTSDCSNLTGEAKNNYTQLLASQQATLSSEPACPGDGNEDKLVNQTDLDNWNVFSQIVNISGNTSSWYDFDHDGFTDTADQMTIQQHLGANCTKKK
jgi:Sulfatase